MPGGSPGDGFGHGPVPDARLGRRSVAHQEGAIVDCGRSDDLEIVLDAKIPDLELAQTDDGQRGGLHAAYPNDAFRAVGNQHLGRGARQREVEDLIGLLARHGGFVERAELAVGFQRRERLA